MATVVGTQRGYRVRVHFPNITIPVDGTVQFVIDGARLQDPLDALGNQALNVLTGSITSGPYSINVTDDNEWLTNQIFANGLPAMKGRYVEVQVREELGTWTTVDIRRT